MKKEMMTKLLGDRFMKFLCNNKKMVPLPVFHKTRNTYRNSIDFLSGNSHTN